MEFLKNIDFSNPSILGPMIIGGCAIIAAIIGAVIARSKKDKDQPQPSQSGGVQVNPKGDANINAPVAGGDQHVGDETKYEAPVAGRDVHIHHHNEGPPVEPKTPTIKPLFQIPPPDDDFIGRDDELTELLNEAEQNGLHITGIRGMGGIGKTQLALKLVEKIEDQYPDAQIYLDLKGVPEEDQTPVPPEEALAHVIRTFEPEAPLPSTAEELRPLFLTVLKNKKTILLMDNALNEEQTKPLIPPKGSILLITSRNKFNLPGIHFRELGTLPKEKSIELLQNFSKRIGDHAGEMAELCGYLPLALNVAGKAVAVNTTLKPEEYIEDLKTNEALGPVDASLAASCQWLDETERNYFYRLCVFPGSFNSLAVAAVWERDEAESKKVLINLVNISLVEWDGKTQRYHLHDLTRVYASKQMGDEENYETQKQHAEYCLIVLQAANALYEKGGDGVLAGLYLFDLEWENIETGQAWAAQYSATDDKAALLCNQYPNTGSAIFLLRQNPRERIQWREPALAASQKLQLRNFEGAHLCQLGSAYSRLEENQKAINCLEKALQISQETGDKIGEGNDLGSLGRAYGNLGEFRKAINYHKQALQIFQAFEDKKNEGVALGNLGSTYSVLGKTQEAISYYEQQLEIAQEVGNKRSEGNAFWNMSLAVDKLGDRAEAIKLAQEGLKIYELIGDPFAENVRKKLEKWKEEG